MNYRKSDKLLGVWVTRPICKRQRGVEGYVKTGEDTQCIGVVDAGFLQAKYEFFDGRRKVLGLFDGHHNHTLVVIAPIWIGWTNDAGKTFVSDEDLIKRHGKTTVGRALQLEGYVA